MVRIAESPLRVAHPFEVRDAIVVLGAPLRRDGSLSRALRERVEAAAELYRRGGGKYVVVTGGITQGAPRAEAAAMAEAIDVPKSALLVEDRALTTAENARFSAELLGPRKRVWVVTQPFHTRRACYLFERAGLDPRAWPVETAVKLRWVVREYAAWGALLLHQR